MRVLSSIFLVGLLACNTLAAEETAPALRNGSLHMVERETQFSTFFSALLGILRGVLDFLGTVQNGVPDIDDCELICKEGRLVFIDEMNAVVSLFDECRTILLCDTVNGDAFAKIDCAPGFFATPLGCVAEGILTPVEDTTGAVPTCTAPACSVFDRNTPLPTSTIAPFFLRNALP